MAPLYITEYNKLGNTDRFDQTVMAPYAIPVTTQTVAISGASARSAPFNASTRFVFITTDTTCSIAFTADNTSVATDANERLVQDAGRFYAVNPSGTVSVISNS